ncbi:hypothetical protein BGZ74_005235, partial [Mortierella antarctica]
MAVHVKAASEAAHIKCESQALIGQYIEHLVKNGVKDEDRKFLDLLCPRVSVKDIKDDAIDAPEDDEDGDETVGLVEGDNEEEEEDGDEDDTDLGGSGGGSKAQQLFLLSFLQHLYSGNYPRKPEVNSFINHLEEFGLYNPPWSRSEINQTMPFSPLDLIAPMTTLKQPYIRFTERELAGFFFKSGGALKQRLVELVTNDGVHATFFNVQAWIGEKEPGFLIKNFIADINPENLMSHQQGKSGHRAKIKLWPLDALRNHLEELKEPGFQPGNY